MWGTDVLVAAQLGPRELSCSAPHDGCIRTAGHGQHDIEGFSPRADVVNQTAAEAPLVYMLPYGALAPHGLTAIVFDVESTVLADVAQMRGDCGHATSTSGHLDHHLRRPPHHGPFDARPQSRGTLGSLA
jgi:hypothetical protein